MTSRERLTQARHVALLSGDAPVLNRCAKEEAHLKQRLAQSTAAYANLTQQSHAAASKEERTRSARLQAQFAALLSNTPGAELPSQSTPLAADKAGRDSLPANAAAAPRTSTPTSGPVVTVAALREVSPGALTRVEPCALGFPDAYEASGFKSIIHWASIAFDETYLTAYGPRRVRDAAQTSTIVSTGGARGARSAQPHRLMAAVACYLLNQVLCADPAVVELWQSKLREPVFDAVFSSQSIASGQERQRQRRGQGADPAVADAIVDRTIGTTSSPLASVASGVGATANASLVDRPFPPRTNLYESRDDFAVLRLWTEEVATEQREKLAVCNRVRGLQHAMARRQMAVHLFQRRARQAEVRAIFIVWRTYTRQRRTTLAAMERYLENRHYRYVEETIFLRWRRFTLRAKVEALQRRLLNIAADRDRAAREHAAAQQVLQEQLASERRHHQQVVFERDTLHAQVLDGHAVEVDALRLMLQMERMQTIESSKWARRWERAAKTFRPAQPCPAMPRAMWSAGRSLVTSEEAFAAIALRNAGDQQVLLQMPYTMILPARERIEQLLLSWVNWVMEASPHGSSWIAVEAFMHGYGTHPRSILQQQKLALSKIDSQAAALAKPGATLGNGTCEFGVYTLMSVVRELRRRYAQTGLVDKAVRRGYSRSTSMASGSSRPNAATVTAQECFHELTYILAAQTCGGLYPPLLSHCSTLSAWLSAEGVFGGPTSSFEGTKRQQRQQHTAFLWLLSSLLVGHVQVMWMAPPGDKGTFSFSSTRPVNDRGNSATAAAWLRCKHEVDMLQLARFNFPVKNGQGLGGAAGAGPTATTSMSTAAGRNTTIVARNTVFPKKRSMAVSSAASASARAAAKAAAEEAEAAAMANATEMTLEEMLRVRHRATRASLSVSSSFGPTLVGRELLLASEDSLTDIEAFLGMVPAQVESLKGRPRANASTTSVNAARSLSIGSGSAADDESDEDRMINGLLHQLFAVEDAKAEMRRTMRLQRRSGEGLGGGSDMEDEEGEEAEVRRTDEHPFADTEPFSFVDPRAANASTHGDLTKSSITLAEEQLELLRSLPGRSHGFDALRPVAVPAAAAADGGAARAAVTTSGSTAADGAGHGAAPSALIADSAAAPLYSFLLNMLDDTTARQQWRGLARVVSSLVVRFRVLDEANDAVRRAAALAAVKEEEEAKTTSPWSRPGSVQRGEALASTSRGDGLANTLPSPARLPPVQSGTLTSASAAATAPSPQATALKSREPTLRGPGAAAGTTTGAGGRVPAQVVPAFSPAPPPPPQAPHGGAVPFSSPVSHAVPKVPPPATQEETSPRTRESRPASSSADPPLAGRWSSKSTPVPVMSTISIRLGEELRSRGVQRPASLVSMQEASPAAEAERWRPCAPAGMQVSAGSPGSATPSLTTPHGRYQREHQHLQQQQQQQQNQQQNQHHREESSPSSATTLSAGAVATQVMTPIAAGERDMPLVRTATLSQPSSEPAPSSTEDAATHLQPTETGEYIAVFTGEGDAHRRSLFGASSSLVSTGIGVRMLSGEEWRSSRPGSARVARVTVRLTEEESGEHDPLTDAPHRHVSDGNLYLSSSAVPLSPERRAQHETQNQNQNQHQRQPQRNQPPQQQQQQQQRQPQRLSTSFTATHESSRQKPVATRRVPSIGDSESSSSPRDVASTVFGGPHRRSSTASHLTTSVSSSIGHFIPRQVAAFDDLPPAPHRESVQMPTPREPQLAPPETPAVAPPGEALVEAPPAEGEQAPSPLNPLQPLVLRPDHKAPLPASRKEHFRMN